MFIHHTPAGIRPPFAHYSFGVEVPEGARLLFCSGQLGITPDDIIPESAEDQATLCFRAIGLVLASADMGFGDLVRLNAYVTSADHLQAYMKVRDRHIASPPPASTLMIVSGFANPAFKVEIEAVAASMTMRKDR
ncbi:RidA family protein [Candidatus Raskinella chloraquaticus]|jgi:2-iminobutanoate/2-iminopropanoate deaminase|uniref:Enamine deaminase RidA n=1 Tax=Candidatus Raskinella chloraquaticus TaxID=1951219 RepID=A0A1W9HUF7_9HYPH|nr:MAG: enamine deaminase RidA [Proteobacteria bacterium SG_bin8]